jgi:hypothetical protein
LAHLIYFYLILAHLIYLLEYKLTQFFAAEIYVLTKTKL